MSMKLMQPSKTLSALGLTHHLHIIVTMNTVVRMFSLCMNMIISGVYSFYLVI